MSFERRCQNHTPLAVRCAPMEDRHGREVLVVIAKMGYRVGPSGEVRAAATEVRFADQLQPARHSLRRPSDLVDEKPGTDVLLLGTAHPPADRETTELDVTLRVAAPHALLSRTVRVYGLRVWYEGPLGIVPGPPAPLGPTPLAYELAYGGPGDPFNPVGSGAVSERVELLGTPAPQLEDPDAPLDARRPGVAGFGPLAPSWQPRAAWLGTCDERWRRSRAPVRPLDFDPRHNCCAPALQWSEVPLGGDEPIEVVGVRPEAPWRFRLPLFAPAFHAVVAGRRARAATHLDTILLDADAGTVELAWRTRVPIPRRLRELELVEVTTTGVLPESVFDA